jgi:hypothetical protein
MKNFFILRKIPIFCVVISIIIGSAMILLHPKSVTASSPHTMKEITEVATQQPQTIPLPQENNQLDSNGQQNLNEVPVLNRYSSTPTLTWDFVTWAVEYQVEVDNNNDFESPEFKDKTDNNFISPINIYEGVWYWRMRARQGDGKWGKWSTVGVFTIQSSDLVNTGRQ